MARVNTLSRSTLDKCLDVFEGNLMLSSDSTDFKCLNEGLTGAAGSSDLLPDN